MIFKDQAYTREDFSEIREFLVDREIYFRTPQDWDYTRCEMWIYTHVERKDNVDFFYQNCHIWRDETGKIVGLFISEKGKEEFSIIPAPEVKEIGEVILDWAINVWGAEKEKIYCDLFEYEKDLITLLTSRNFKKRDGIISHGWKYDLTKVEYEIQLEDGFKICSINEDHDLKERCEVVSDAYNNGDLTKFTLEEYEWRCSAPGYNSDFDLACISPEGIYVSCCTGWLDQHSKSAIIETVGTRHAFRRKGYAKKVVAECFNRLRTAGAKVGYIRSFNEIADKTYGSLKPSEEIHSYIYILRK
ncbi:MAG: hypothetical protein KAX49_02975 [Halanaerobiales bacterium]|nr:hypothetical protein [Halanaerobiales bacterium]